MVRNGLGDREGNVRKAAAAMLGGWVDQVEGDLLEVSCRMHSDQECRAQARDATDSLSSYHAST